MSKSNQNPPSSHNVYTIETHGSPNHEAIFIETAGDGSGTRYHVTGTILMGMEYEERRSPKPDDSPSFVPGSKILQGIVQGSAMGAFEAICKSVEVPGSQVRLNGKRKDPSKPIRRCGDWVRDALAKLHAEGVLQQA